MVTQKHQWNYPCNCLTALARDARDDCDIEGKLKVFSDTRLGIARVCSYVTRQTSAEGTSCLPGAGVIMGRIPFNFCWSVFKQADTFSGKQK